MLNKSLRKHFPASILVFSFLLASFGLQAQTESDSGKALPDNVPGLLVRANEAYAAKDYLTFRKAMEQINKKRPHNSEYMYQLVIAYALLDEKRSAYDLMLRMQQQGLAYDFSKPESTLNIRNTEVFDYVNDMMKMAGEPVGEAEPVFTLPANVLLPETMAWDESRQKFLVGTVAEGSIFAVGKDGQAIELLKANDENGMWAVFDILVDEARKKLWVTSAATPKFSGFDPIDKGRSALFEYDLESLELVRRYPVPVDGMPHILGSMVLGPNGDIFIADRALPIVYRKSANEQKLKAVMASREMVSLRGVALQPDGRIMYVADRELGILIVDFEAGSAGKLVVPKTLNLGGIDGLYLWENRLIIIQNGIKPQRVLRLQLDSSGTRVEAIGPLAVARPEFNYPSYGVVLGDDLYYFANSQWGSSKDELKPVTVLRTSLNSSGDLEQPDMLEYLRQRGETLRKQTEEAEKTKP
jgi:sugar lactone lactonase YvrE